MYGTEVSQILNFQYFRLFTALGFWWFLGNRLLVECALRIHSMAWMELRILTAKMIFRFDFELVDANLDWNRDGKCFVLWQKPALWTKAMDVLAM